MLAELARGGMGIVHLAEARGPGGFEKLVVVKELKAELADDPVYTAMFLDEARLAARLSHRHIVQTNEVGCEDGRYFMALELLEGGSLHQVRTKLGLRALPTTWAFASSSPCSTRSTTRTSRPTPRARRSASCIATSPRRTCSSRSTAA